MTLATPNRVFDLGLQIEAKKEAEYNRVFEEVFKRVSKRRSHGRAAMDTRNTQLLLLHHWSVCCQGSSTLYRGPLLLHVIRVRQGKGTSDARKGANNLCMLTGVLWQLRGK